MLTQKIIFQFKERPNSERQINIYHKHGVLLCTVLGWEVHRIAMYFEAGEVWSFHEGMVGN